VLRRPVHRDVLLQPGPPVCQLVRQQHPHDLPERLLVPLEHLLDLPVRLLVQPERPLVRPEHLLVQPGRLLVPRRPPEPHAQRVLLHGAPLPPVLPPEQRASSVRAARPPKLAARR